MPTMNVSLPAGFVASGDYGSASEVVRESLRRLRREIVRGAAQAEAGAWSPHTIEDLIAASRAEDDAEGHG